MLANLFVNRQPTRFGLVATREMERRARPVLARLGLDVDLDVPVGTVTIAERQLIELARVLLEQPRVLILDEPNSALNDRETQRLFAILRELAADGHHGAVRLAPPRGGVLDRRPGDGDARRARGPDAGHGVTDHPAGRRGDGRHEAGVALSVAVDGAVDRRCRGARRRRGLSVGSGLVDVSFDARPGEIVGLAGLAGSGIELLLGALFGERRGIGGNGALSRRQGAAVEPDASGPPRGEPRPADRRTQGLMLDRSVASNIVQVAVGAMRSTNPWLSRRTTDAVADRQIARLGIKTAGPSALVSSLSGGNQQKVVLAKWLEVSPTVVLLDDPTRGVDVGAKHEIYAPRAPARRRRAGSSCCARPSCPRSSASPTASSCSIGGG